MRRDEMARNVLDADCNYAHHGGDLKLVPAGPYCYRIAAIEEDTAGGMPTIRINACPYWGRREIEGEVFGYCAHLKSGDWDEDGTSLLFDMVKCCGVNDDEPYETQTVQ